MARTKRRKPVRRRRRSRGLGATKTRLEHLAHAVIAAKRGKCHVAQNHLDQAYIDKPSMEDRREYSDAAVQVRRLCR